MYAPDCETENAFQQVNGQGELPSLAR